MNARRDRWLSLAEVIALLAERFPDLLKLRNASRRKKVRRIIRRAERRDGERYSKLVPAPGGRELVVSRNALESLMPYDGRVFAQIERATAENAQNHRDLKRQVKGHGARLRTVEQKQELMKDFFARWTELDGTDAGQQRDTFGHPSDQRSRAVKAAAG